MNTNTNTSWDIPEGLTDSRSPGEGRTNQDFALHERLVRQVVAVGNRYGWSKKKMADRIGMPQGTFSQWFSGKYEGRFDKNNELVSNFLEGLVDVEAVEFKVPSSPRFIETRTTNELRDLLTAAQVLPTMVIGTYGAGMGKTFTARHFRQTNPHCWLATMTPYTKTVHGMLQTVASAVGLPSTSGGQIVSAIGEKIRRRNAPTLLIVDESQNLIDDAVNQLRHFVDDYDCGIALLGNTEFYGRLKGDWSDKQKYAQLRRRIFKRVRRDKPEVDDLKAFIKAHDITDEAQTKFLVGVGMKPGAFGQIDMTVKLAKMTAAGNERAVHLDDLKRAWTNRDVEI